MYLNFPGIAVLSAPSYDVPYHLSASFSWLCPDTRKGREGNPWVKETLSHFPASALVMSW